MDLSGTEEPLRHRKTLDMPAGPPPPPGGVPGRVLPGLVRLPEREVSRVLLERIDVVFLVLELVEPLSGQPAVLPEASDTEVDVTLDLVRIAAVDQVDDEADDVFHRLGRARVVVDLVEAEAADVL